MRTTLGLGLVAAVVAAAAHAHPHFGKTVSASLPGGVEASVRYTTVPANETHAETAKVGAFVTPRRPVLKLSGELKAGATTLAAGEYTVGAVKIADKDWALAVYPGLVQRGETPAADKLIRLESVFATDKGVAEHLLIDITPGHGKLQGRTVLTLHFGGLYLAGALA